MDIFMLKNCTTSTPNTRKQPYVYKSYQGAKEVSSTTSLTATSYEILVAKTEFLVALATRKAQFQTLYTSGYVANSLVT